MLYRRAGSLEEFLAHETGVEDEAILAYLSDGQRLRSDNVRELAGSKDQVYSIQSNAISVLNSVPDDICVQQVLPRF